MTQRLWGECHIPAPPRLAARIWCSSDVPVSYECAYGMLVTGCRRCMPCRSARDKTLEPCPHRAHRRTSWSCNHTFSVIPRTHVRRDVADSSWSHTRSCSLALIVIMTVALHGFSTVVRRQKKNRNLIRISNFLVGGLVCSSAVTLSHCTRALGRNICISWMIFFVFRRAASCCCACVIIIVIFVSNRRRSFCFAKVNYVGCCCR
jgi:hypothetical protein